MRKSYSTKQIIRFRCWSRKRYAAFCSLGRAVTIGCLSKGVTEIALGKQRGVIFSLLRFFREDGLEREEEDSGGIPPRLGSRGDHVVFTAAGICGKR